MSEFSQEIARTVLETHAGAYYVAANDTQRNRVIEMATRAIDSTIDRICEDALAKVPLNPT